MKRPDSTLPDDVAFEGAAHASGIALAALADGQADALDARVHEHVEGCAACTARLGEAALLSARVGDALRVRATALATNAAAANLAVAREASGRDAVPH